MKILLDAFVAAHLVATSEIRHLTVVPSGSYQNDKSCRFWDCRKSILWFQAVSIEVGKVKPKAYCSCLRSGGVEGDRRSLLGAEQIEPD